MKHDFFKAARKGLRVAKKYTAHTALLFSIGNIPIYTDVYEVNSVLSGSGLGFSFALASAAAVCGTRAYQMLKKLPEEVPHMTLAFTNVAAAACSAYAIHNNLDDFNIFQSSDARLAVGMTAGFAGWGVANGLAALKKRLATTAWAVGDICATQFTQASSLIGGLALLKSLREIRGEEDLDRAISVNGPISFTFKHGSFERLLLGSYLLATLEQINSGNLGVACGFALFSGGYYVLKHDLNACIRQDLQKALSALHARP